MADYLKMYCLLCKAIDAAIGPLEQIPAAQPQAKALREALLEAEEIYLRTDDSKLIQINKK